ncbi:MAG: hypothetical protein ACFCUU_04995 [Cyclobacteriaceae bacterium]
MQLLPIGMQAFLSVYRHSYRYAGIPNGMQAYLTVYRHTYRHAGSINKTMVIFSRCCINY